MLPVGVLVSSILSCLPDDNQYAEAMLRACSNVPLRALRGCVASAAVGEDPTRGAVAGAVYGAVMMLDTCAQCFDSSSVPDNDGNNQGGLCHGSRNLLFAIIAAVVALYSTSPDFGNNLIGVGAIFGLFQMGDTVNIANSF